MSGIRNLPPNFISLLLCSVYYINSGAWTIWHLARIKLLCRVSKPFSCWPTLLRLSSPQARLLVVHKYCCIINQDTQGDEQLGLLAAAHLWLPSYSCSDTSAKAHKLSARILGVQNVAWRTLRQSAWAQHLGFVCYVIHGCSPKTTTS